MNIKKLSDFLSRLGDLRPAGTRIVLTEPDERTIKVSVVGLADHSVDFDQRLSLRDLPGDWQEILPHGSDFESVSADQIDAARRALEQRIDTRSWHFSLSCDPATLSELLNAQGAQEIKRLFQFQTLGFKLELELPICGFRALSVQAVGLDEILSQVEIRTLFNNCSTTDLSALA
jgi:hypothetical protein